MRWAMQNNRVWMLRGLPEEIQRRIAVFTRIPDRDRRSRTAVIAHEILYTEVEEGAVVLTPSRVFFISERDLSHIPQTVRDYWTSFMRLMGV